MPSRLAIRSAYSLLWGTASPKSIIAHLANQGCTAVAITDRDNLYGLHESREAARKHGLKCIVGAQLTTEIGSLFAFVQTPLGYSRLCTLITQHNLDPKFDYIPALQSDSEGLILVAKEPSLLERLADSVPTLHAAITPRWLGSIPTARRLGIPLAALEDTAIIEQSQYELHRVLRAIALGTTVGMIGEEHLEANGSTLCSHEQYLATFSSWPEAIENTETIADLCAAVPLFTELVFPPYAGIETSVSAELRRRVLKGAEIRYGELSDAILERIQYELDIIEKKGFASYFLVMDDIVSLTSRTCGRGSGAASAVSYALGITNVDPIAHNLYFERFLSMGRTDPPDIDVDFAWDERDAILHLVIDRFGRDHCARVANHNRFRFRSALRETAKAYGIADSDVTRMERQLHTSGLSETSDPLWHTICEIATRLEGLPRGISMHCGGVVITPEPICRYAPIEQSAEGYPLLAWEKDGTEAAGLVKIDLLGNRSLAVIRDALHLIRSQGTPIDERTWNPEEDQATIDALAKGNSMGVFYIESPAMRQLQQKTGRGDFAHIVIHSSIIRPAANAYISEYVRRLKGGSWNSLHPRLASILDETYGILCYQEDVSKCAIALAGFNEIEADSLRKVIAKKADGERLSQYEEQFFSGCRNHGIDNRIIHTIWDMMLSFDGYSFCKPHSASYAMVSFQSAYLRIHHPAAFMASVLSNQGGYYRPQAYISESRRMGLHVAGPDINRSNVSYHAEGLTVVVGLMAIGGLSLNAMEEIVENRKQWGPFVSLETCSTRLQLNRDDWVALVAAGACDSLAGNLPRSVQLRTILMSGYKTSTNAEQGLLFDQEPRMESQRSNHLALSGRQRRTEQELMIEFETLGFLRDHHPLMLWAHQIARIHRIRGAQLSSYVGKLITVVGWPITRKTIWTKQGLPMDFISFEDESALFETVLFPQVHERYRKLLYGQRPLCIRGLVHCDNGAYHLEVDTLYPLKEVFR